MTLSEMKCVQLRKKTLKTLGTHFSHNKDIKQDENFCKHIIKLETAVLVWRPWYSTPARRMAVFKSLTTSKKNSLFEIIDINLHFHNFYNVYKVREMVIGQQKDPMLRKQPLWSKCDNSGLNNKKINSKIVTKQCVWAKRLFDKDSHK